MIWTWAGQVHLKCRDVKDLLDFCYNIVVLFLKGSSYLRCYMRIAVHLLITKESSRDRYQTLASCSDKGAEQGCIFLVLVLAESALVKSYRRATPTAIQSQRWDACSRAQPSGPNWDGELRYTPKAGQLRLDLLESKMTK